MTGRSEWGDCLLLREYDPSPKVFWQEIARPHYLHHVFRKPVRILSGGFG